MAKRSNIITRIGAIVPAYDEGPRIHCMLEVITKSKLLNKIVVVNDGSRDETAQVAATFPVQLEHHGRNLGKGAALQTGLAHLRDMDIVLFLDADLIGLTETHLRQLVAPLRRNHSLGMTIGTFIEGRWVVDLQQKYFAILNGQRALSRRFIDSLPDLAWSRFGVEVLLSRYARYSQAKTEEVFLTGITHVLKEEKFGPVRGMTTRLQMYYEALSAGARFSRMVHRPAPDYNEYLKMISAGR